MIMRSLLFAATVMAIGSGLVGAAENFSSSSDPKIKGRQVAEESERRNLGFGDTKAAMKMQLVLRKHDILSMPEEVIRSGHGNMYSVISQKI